MRDDGAEVLSPDEQSSMLPVDGEFPSTCHEFTFNNVGIDLLF
jgi:hypothetical protein